MGLDMYLYAKKYVSEYSNKDEFEKLNALEITGKGDMKARYIVCEAIYWRKANAIHGWFVDRVQSGTDDCREYYVAKEELSELANLCREVLKEKNPELLTPRGGFFFGSTEIDDWYWDDIKRTADEIEAVLKVYGIDEWDFYYHSSW